ncbi:DivIVA domain-containing protein [Micromonospora zhanjiangensis]|uniref:DivIVA domain-containing protein n=1 Tax=Micromonospora zhanjiangensis TaxID=1522057 RepID=A0ABV8KVP9_9ACTN
MHSATSEHPMVTAATPGLPTQALQVLTMAQRTAEEHVSTAHRQAQKIRADAEAAAEQIARDANLHAQNVRREADKVLAEAEEAADQAAQQAQQRVEDAQRNAEKIVADARAQAEAIAAHAQDNAEEMRQQAQRRFDDVVGSLGARREALQEQIEALERFDREYRGRLTTFMQGQLRALWVDRPQVNIELEPVLPAPAADEPVDEVEAVEQDLEDEHEYDQQRHDQEEPNGPVLATQEN